MTQNLRHILYVLVCAMAPVVELRGAIPLGAGFGFPWLQNYIIAVIGNMIPVPFILLFIRQILRWMQGKKHLDKIANFILNRAEKKTDSVMRFAGFGLFVFVAIPLPGTGAWTGAIIAALLNMRMRYAIPSIFAGILLAGFIMSGISYGFLSFLGFLAG